MCHLFPSEYKGQNNRLPGRTPQPLGCKGQVEFEEWRGRKHTIEYTDSACYPSPPTSSSPGSLFTPAASVQV